LLSQPVSAITARVVRSAIRLLSRGGGPVQHRCIALPATATPGMFALHAQVFASSPTKTGSSLLVSIGNYRP